MPLLDLVENSFETVLKLNIQQVVSNAGDGRLRDGSLCSDELRQFLSLVPSEKLQEYIDGCLNQSFENSGLVLQELVNELGKRLEYDIEPGLYQGRRNQVGFDGIWQTAQGQAIVVEVKTTDAYRIRLNTLADYRKALIDQGRIPPTSSILIIVGREDTGDIESQIRGSRHAWDMRVISVDALMQLVLLKEGTEEEETLRKIRSLLTPIEYTRLDNLVDVLFTAAKDVETSSGVQESSFEEAVTDNGSIGSQTEEPRKQDRTDAEEMTQLREAIIAAFSKAQATYLTPKSKAMFWNSAKDLRVCCTISKKYNRGGQGLYWYAFHPRWQTFLKDAPKGFCIFGCMGKVSAYALPLSLIEEHLTDLYVTDRDNGRMYWHIELIEEDDQMFWLLRKSNTKVPLKPYEVTLG
jgi:hypothetical protein